MMIFIGFGFLMTFLKKYAFSALVHPRVDSRLHYAQPSESNSRHADIC